MPLDAELMSGVKKEFRITSLQLTIANRTANQITSDQYSIQIPFMYGGYIEFKNGRVHAREVVIPVPKTLTNASVVYLEDDSDHAIQGGRGGRGWKKFKNFVKKATPFVQKASKFVRNLPGVSSVAGDNTALGQVMKIAGAGTTHVGGGV